MHRATIKEALSNCSGSMCDALMTEEASKTRQYTKVEIKYSRDPHISHQETSAHQQHTQPAELLQEWDPAAIVLTVPHGSVRGHLSCMICICLRAICTRQLGMRGRESLARIFYYQAAKNIQQVWELQAPQTRIIVCAAQAARPAVPLTSCSTSCRAPAEGAGKPRWHLIPVFATDWLPHHTKYRFYASNAARAGVLHAYKHAAKRHCA